MTDAQLRRLLYAIRLAALAPYPWPQDANPNDDRLVAALGEIAGIAARALEATKPK